jgi:DNA-binding beta-propeller fold protein YncE
MYKHLSTILVALIALPLLAQTLPSVPSTITYQGRITDVDFTVPDGDYEMTFLIYDNSPGGNLLWQETQPGVAVSNGLYKVELGADSPLTFATFERLNVWLEVRIFGEALGPRRRIVSAPFALRAEGEVPEGAVILSQNSGDANILALGYTQEGGTVGALYPYKKNPYNPAAPRVPTRVTYQGRVEPLAGATIGATANLVFTLYDADTLGSLLWTEAHPNVPLAGGLFCVELGSLDPVDPVDLVQKDLYLSLSVNGQTLTPRQKLSSTAYALKINSPVPPGGIVLSATNPNPDLAAKKFSLFPGSTVKGRYPFTKDAFLATDPSVPLLINYQGRLTDPINGAPLSADTIDMRLALYDDPSAGSLLYSETINDVPLSLGVFDVLLGSGDTLTPNTFTSPNAFLALTLTKSGSTENLLPRQRITSVPFALTGEGAMPPSALILAGTTNDPNLLTSGFQATGDTVKSYYIYVMTDVDTTPPELTIDAPTVNSAYSVDPVPVTVHFSDLLSGVNLPSFQALLNGLNITANFTITPTGATGNVTGSLGMNVLIVSISDKMGNTAQRVSYFYVDTTGSSPLVTIVSPVNGTMIYTNTPLIKAEFEDSGGGINLDAILIQINGTDRTSFFNVIGEGDKVTASWRPSLAESLPGGTLTVYAQVSDYFGHTGSANSVSVISSTCVNPTITTLSRPLALAGETLGITGTGFSTTMNNNEVMFFKGIAARPYAATTTRLSVVVPPTAISGKLKVTVGDCASGDTTFIIGLKYGFVTNYNSSWVSGSPATGAVAAIDFDLASPGDTANYIPCGSKPFDVAVSPDGKAVYASDNTGNKVCIINAARASDSDTVQTINITGPRYLTVSPDGLEVYVGSESGALYTIRNHVLLTGRTQTLGNQINDLKISPLHQMLYVVRNRGNSTRGQVNYVSIDKANSDYLQSKYIRDTYFKPVGIAITPDQAEIYIANNRSNAADYSGPQGQSFSILDAINGLQSLSHGAVIQPYNDAHDVNWPFDLVFDPRGKFFFASFAEGFASSTSVYGTSNNVGVQTLSSYYWNEDFQAATPTKRDDPNRSPKGLAVSPGGEFIFSANFGSFTGEGDKIMALDYQKVRTAIESDPSDNSYNLTGAGPENLESPSVPGFPNIVRTASGFDGPRNIAFQEFPIVDIYPPVVHLALGGVAPGANTFTARVHPIYGSTVRVGLSDGSSLTIGSSVNSIWHIQWLAPDRNIFSANLVSWDRIYLISQTEGIGELLAESEDTHYPSNLAFVTVPPQEFIQILYSEACANSNEITYRALAGVIKNRMRLTRGRFRGQMGGGTCPLPEWSYTFDFPPVTSSKKEGRKLNGADQIMASNATELLAVHQINKAFTDGYNSKYPPAARYHSAESRTMPDADKIHYDQCVRIAGDAMLDLTRTLTELNTNEGWQIPQPDPNYLDVVKDPTGGSFSFYSPTNLQWGDSSITNSIAGTLESGDTTFPNRDSFESGKVCGKYFPFFCGDPPHASYIQVVVVEGISLNDCADGDTSHVYDTAPQFVFFKLREKNDRAVVWGPSTP